MYVIHEILNAIDGRNDRLEHHACMLVCTYVCALLVAFLSDLDAYTRAYSNSPATVLLH